MKNDVIDGKRVYFLDDCMGTAGTGFKESAMAV